MNKQRSLGIILQYAQMALSIIIQIAYTPIMLKILGQNEYGIYNIASSTISYLTLFSLGLGGSYLRYYSIYKKKEDDDGIKKLNGLYLFVFLILGTIAFIAGMVLTVNVRWMFNETYTNEEIEIAKTLMFLLSINLALSFPGSVFSSYIMSQEKFIFQKLINIVTTIIGPVSNVIMLYCGLGSIGMVTTTTAITILTMLINVFYCFKKINMKISFKQMDFKLLKSIAYFSLFIAMNQIIDQINWQTDKIILGKMINGGAVAIYAVGSNINTMYISFSTAISGVFAPKVNQIVAGNKPDMDQELTELFIKVGRIQWFIMMLILTGFIFFGRYFVNIWAGEEYGEAYFIALMLICPVTISLIQNIGIEIQRAKNKHKFRSVIYLIMAFLNIGISIYFTHLWGTLGVAFGTTLSLLLANGLIMNIYYQKAIGIDVVKFWKSILSTLLGFILPVVFGSLLMIFYNYLGLWDFFLLIIAYTIVYCASVYFLSFNKYEKNIINTVFGKIKNAFKFNKKKGTQND